MSHHFMVDSPQSNDTKIALQTELAAAQAQANHSSLLRDAIDFVTNPYHHRSQSVTELEDAARQFDSGNGLVNQLAQQQAKDAIRDSQSSRQAEADSYNIISGAVKTAVSFTPGKLGYLASGTVYALDEAKGGGQFNLGDASLGFAKGLFMRGAVSRISKGDDSPALMALKLGVTSRIIDTGLTQSNYLEGKTGEVTFGSFARGLLNTGESALNPVALGSDIVTAGIGQGVLKIAPEALSGNSFRALTTMAFTRGYASGLAQEGQSEYESGKFSLARMTVFPLATALSSSIAAAPGNQSVYRANWALENAASIRDLDFKLVSVSPEDVRAISARRGRPVETTVKPVGEGLQIGEPEKLNIARASIPTDWIAAAIKSLKFGGTASGADQLRFVSRPKGDENAPWQMALNSGTTPVSDLIAKTSSYYQGKKTGKLLADLKEPAIKFIGSGSETGAFMLASGGVLKVSSLLSVDKVNDWGKLPYDARVMYGPTIIGEKINPRYPDSKSHEGASILIQEPLRTPVKEEQAAQLRRDMADSKIDFHDYNFHLLGDQVSWAVDQVGIDATGKPVMLDYGARRRFWNWDKSEDK